MKKILPLIILLLIASTSFGQFRLFKPKAKPSPTPVLVEKSKAPIQDAKKIVDELKQELNVAKSENAKLKSNLAEANNNLQKGSENIVKLNRDIAALKEWGVVQQAEATKWLEKYNNAVKRYHRLKWIAAIIAAAAGVLLGLQFMNLAPPPYNLLIPVGSAGLLGLLVWMFL